MKTKTNFCRVLLALTAFIPAIGFSQLNIVSSNGYVASVTVVPTAILPSTVNCPWGYNYNVKMSYAVVFTGINRPASLYTLQGYLTCGSNSHFFDLPNSPSIGTVNSTSNQWNGTTDCATATVHSLACNTARIEIDGPGISARTISFPITFSVLPVGLISFEAVAKDGAINLSWATASENNNHHFTVERSADGTAWVELETVAGQGNSVTRKEYNWTDLAPLADKNFYRLKQTDINGAVAYSWIRMLEAIGVNAPVRLYPQPNMGNTVTFTGLKDMGTKNLELLDMAGSSRWQQKFSGTSIVLPVVVPGMYLMRITEGEGRVHVLRYIKQ